MNPRIGSGMQQAHKPSVEKTVEVVRDHEGGTSGSLAATCRRDERGNLRILGVDTGGDVDGGADLWTTLKEALGGTEPSGCEMRLRTRNAPNRSGGLRSGQPDGERTTAGKPMTTLVNPTQGRANRPW